MRDAATVAGMLCPVCRVGLTMSDRQGVEIDYCPQCRGVWLDRGELDKIIERSGAMEMGGGGAGAPNDRYDPPLSGSPPGPPTRAPGMSTVRPPDTGYYGDDDGRYARGNEGRGGRRGRRSFLSDLFD